MPQLSFKAFDPLPDPLAILPYTHKFPSQPARLNNLIRAGRDEQEWYTDKELPGAEVLFAVEKLRGNISLFAESEAALEAALWRLEVDKESERKAPLVLSSVPLKLVPVVIQALTRLGWEIRNSTEEIYHALVLDPKSADESKLSQFSPVDPLVLDDAPLLLSHWKYAKHNPRAAAYIAHTILHHPTAGIRNEKGELEAWVIVHMDWNVGMLHTQEGARRKGHGKRLVAVVSRELLAQGLVPHAFVSTDNPASLGLFAAMGFKPEPVQVCWIVATYG